MSSAAKRKKSNRLFNCTVLLSGILQRLEFKSASQEKLSESKMNVAKNVLQIATNQPFLPKENVIRVH